MIFTLRAAQTRLKKCLDKTFNAQASIIYWFSLCHEHWATKLYIVNPQTVLQV